MESHNVLVMNCSMDLNFHSHLGERERETVMKVHFHVMLYSSRDYVGEWRYLVFVVLLHEGTFCNYLSCVDMLRLGVRQLVASCKTTLSDARRNELVQINLLLESWPLHS